MRMIRSWVLLSRMGYLLYVGLFIALLVWQCSTPPNSSNLLDSSTPSDSPNSSTLEPPKPMPLPDVSPTHKDAVVQGIQTFSLDLFKQLAGSRAGNLFLSGYSISTALTMTYAGARGDTAQEMAKVLHLPTEQKDIHKANAWLLAYFNNQGIRENYLLRVVNRLWGQKGYVFLPEFLKLLADDYLASLELIDFHQDPAQAANTINRWVAQQTQDKIKNLLQADDLSRDTVLALVNAIYFKGAWSEPFSKHITQGRLFYQDGVRDVVVPTMSHSEAVSMSFHETDTLQVLELPYQGHNLVMMILVPKAKNGLATLEQSLSSALLNQWLSKLSFTKALVYLPKFKFTSRFPLKEPLSNMGMKQAFVMGADFSGMDGHKNLHIGSVVHQSFVDMNEEGTEAAASTAVTMKNTSAPPPPQHEFRVNRPFVFLIRDKETRTILFMGRVTNPLASE